MTHLSNVALPFLFAAAIACSSKGEAPTSREAGPTPTARLEAAPVEREPVAADVVADTASGPRIELSLLGRYQDPVFGAAGLPAVSSDGAFIAYGEEEKDGGRGNPNFRLVVREAARDRPVVAKEILAASPAWTLDAEPIVRGKIDEANEILGERKWKPLEALLASADDLDGALSGADIHVALRGGALVVTRRGAEILRRSLAGLVKTDGGCPGTVLLAEAYVSSTRLLARFDFNTDGCWREAEFHAFVLP